ncbi:helix-turn-helix domain-containing protein [Avibacterium paragallinarum]|uniref:helix-turn-helix domain-containing protein n=1 Tax=Avibacterium paragallinarum TaxID=728 RepID=UPI00021ACFDC|nr:helix-turn-helix domain-containing protein [Avibacterium paragallinarum]AZI14127.1 DNA-binding protein [Avibacterium paragallinarum]QIR11597.1 helix-turn-helix domain-containing protein [Avibacterium paragallinarum]QJE09429.1 helix-turn-helix domain-containing protein [Avibacterium paragallinarum]QJE11625.1 helix-turn-helix domain-containing protein [Avibacterium paragallinarum]QJE13824.1 helix-turn-helix domain-containing protein [Avibacterium paragallinarum]
MLLQDNIDYYFTIQELQERFRVSRSTILRLIESGKLIAIKIGRQIRIPES